MTGILICFIPIFAILMVFATGMLSIFLNFLKRKKMFELYHQERMAAIDKGVELPPLPEDFFQEDGGKKRRTHASHGTLLSGLILTFVGITSYVAIYFTLKREEDDADFALYALIPVGVGVACLIYYFAVARKVADEIDAERKAKLTETSRP